MTSTARSWACGGTAGRILVSAAAEPAPLGAMCRAKRLWTHGSHLHGPSTDEFAGVGRSTV
ncbi:hypothetical protein AB0J80_15995 [Actinoplanes sp. NPDC049548]|uniref:hypothetical protein n=1 Tax=Actinoplanes sp. NPDC049548 TaxID=3155152 RepID=UPI003428AAA6